MSRRTTPNVTPFIPPLGTPRTTPGAPPPAALATPSGAVGNPYPNAPPPAWAQQAQTPGNYPIYPNTPYSGTPFLPPGMSPAGGGFGGGPLPGVSVDYAGYPNPATLGPSPWLGSPMNLPPPNAHHTPWGPPSAPLQPMGTPWGPPGAFHPQHQTPYSAAPYPSPYGPPMGVPQQGWGPPQAAFTPGAGPGFGLDGWGPQQQMQSAPAWGQFGGQGGMGGPPQDPMQRMRRPVEFEGDRVSHWMAGDHYGVALEPFLVQRLHAQITVNPLLTQPPDDNSRDFLKWNMLFQSNMCQLSSDDAHISWAKGRDAPATFPRITSMRLVCARIPFTIEINAVNPELGVTCGDVIDQISVDLHRFSGGKEFEVMPRTQQKKLGEAYQRNRSREHGVPGGSLGQGMRRLDWLCENCIFGGIQKHDRLVKQICGVMFPCTFELLCTQRWVQTAREIADQEAMARTVREREERQRREIAEEQAALAAEERGRDDGESVESEAESRRRRARRHSRNRPPPVTVESATDEDENDGIRVRGHN